MKLAEWLKTNKFLIESASNKYDIIHVDQVNSFSEWVHVMMNHAMRSYTARNASLDRGKD